MEEEIIHKALENLYRNTGIKGFFQQNDTLDGILQLNLDDIQFTYVLEVKRELRQHQLHQLEAYHMRYENLMVIAEHIFPRIKEELRLKGIAYLETNGNIFLKREGVYYFIDTNKAQVIRKETANRAFTKTGLKVLFHLLNDKNLINHTQREIAEIVGVGLGNIPQVIDGLKETGYLIPLNKQQYVWENRKELLDRWINEYATELRPKLLKGKYTLKQDWQTIHLDNQHTVWGGEPAADLLTNYLRPEHFILYTDEKQSDLIKNYHCIPKNDGELEVLEIFWKPENNTAPPILIYTELMLTGGKRNKETAEKIYNEFIEPIL
ncbi:type IV toxin-antitoxin system AbiEi family antitoxin [Fluviicola taffensis]|uniref:Uncharacterized protein n=1 Tax=Fluviicola taffensis (strain DSM 16823 / NCIMB 13979 / RW262) TaxID=755732 RepID=F2IFE3_FLUTR|nr:type IV toxin-antitoxin system AbiEi family antitoxin [Fluviicola taffensis]AEA44628.1 hypothetical protein Fluta_2647 [Fluviicola taffensis DSM 16823]